MQEFARNLEQNIYDLSDDLSTGTYTHGSYQPFIIHDPKRRQIHKASVRDRLVHQAVTDIIEPLFEKHFIHDSYSCRVGKGTHAGVNRLRKFLRQASNNNTRTVYALKLDIKQFFASVDHSKILDLLSISITDQGTLKLLYEIIVSFSVTPGKGLPLGNVTSQLFANVYLHQLDWLVKHNLHWKHYLRYCDDFVLVSTNREKLLNLLVPITQFLETELNMNIHPDKISLRSWAQGVDFLGYVLKPDSTVLRTKTKNRMLKRVNKDNLSSYLGLCSHADSFEQQQIKTISSRGD